MMFKRKHQPTSHVIHEQFAPTAQEEAEKINSQTGQGASGMSLVTDQEFWEGQGISTGEELALSLLSQTYSDMYKEMHGIRPRWESFETAAEAGEAVNALQQEYADAIKNQELEEKEMKRFEEKEKEIQALMPGEFDFQELPKRGPMRPRNESAARLTKNQLREIINEAMKGETKTHPLTDLARRQASTFGGGMLVDVDGYENLVGMGLDFTRGVAPSAASKGPLSEARVRRVVRKILRSMMR